MPASPKKTEKNQNLSAEARTSRVDKGQMAGGDERTEKCGLRCKKTPKSTTVKKFINYIHLNIQSAVSRRAVRTCDTHYTYVTTSVDTATAFVCVCVCVFVCVQESARVFVHRCECTFASKREPVSVVRSWVHMHECDCVLAPGNPPSSFCPVRA